MTRWARAGNSQKHNKMPEDPTSWQELSQGIKNPTKFKRKQCDPIEDKSPENIRTDKNGFNNSKKFCKAELCNKNQNIGEESSVFSSVKKYSSCDVVKNSGECYVEEKTMSKRQLKKLKRAEKKKLKIACNPELKCTSDIGNTCKIVSPKQFAEENRDCNETVKTIEPISANRLSKKQMEGFNSKSMKHNVKLSNLSEGKNLQENPQKRVNSYPNDKKLKKKELFMKKPQEKRAQNGISLLSQAAENRLYRIKKRLHEKGYTPEMIKNIIRKERRKAELEFHETSLTKTCYNCGQPGHFRAECQVSPNKTSQETEACLKCGSEEHNSNECTEKDFGQSFLTCFVCKGQGHISRDCPDKKKRGGVKDEEEPLITLRTINEGESVDDEIIDIPKNTEKTKFKKPKVVVF